MSAEQFLNQQILELREQRAALTAQLEAERARSERLERALGELMHAHRKVFGKSLFAAQFAAEAIFREAWKEAESALATDAGREVRVGKSDAEGE